jgi:hypothetical protein
MGRKVLAVVAGAVVAFLIVLLVEGLGLRIYPPPPGVDVGDPASRAAAVAAMPLGALLFVLAAWVLGAGIGAAVATAVVRREARWPGLVVGGLILAGSLYNLMVIPHPVWFTAAAVALVPAATWLTTGPAKA